VCCVSTIARGHMPVTQWTKNALWRNPPGESKRVAGGSSADEEQGEVSKVKVEVSFVS